MRENLKSLRETVLGEIEEELRFYQLRLSKLVIVRWPILLQYVANNDWIDYNGVAHFRIFWGKTVLHIYG